MFHPKIIGYFQRYFSYTTPLQVVAEFQPKIPN